MKHRDNPIYAGTTTAELYLSAFRAFPGRTALVAGNQSLTYRELETRCYQIARLLLSKGLKRQDTVAFLVSNRIEAVLATIAIQLIGLRYVALHPMASEEDHAFVLEDAQVNMLIADSLKFPDRTRALQQRNVVPHVLTLDTSSIHTGLLNETASMDGSRLPLDARPEDYTKIAYSGGTTGRSKGIMHTHRTTVTMLNYQLANYEWPNHIRYLAATPISHAAGSLILPTFIRGGTVYLQEKYDAQSFLEIVQTHQINTTFLVPTQIYGLLDSPHLQEYDHSSLELILYGAAPMAPARLLEALKKIGPVFGQLYGQAEAPMVISYLRKEDHDPARPHLLASCGRIIPGNQVKLLDQQMQEVKPGEIGELCVRGPLVMQGYLNRPEENEKVFAGQWLHTGDMAREDEQGYLYIVDRAKDMIISGGFNVYPSEVEHCLARHPDVAMAAVIGIPHDKWGEEVTAIVVKKQGTNPSKQELIDFVLQHKGAVNTPKTIIFTNELPLTSLGKINKKAIRSQYWQGHDRMVS